MSAPRILDDAGYYRTLGVSPTAPFDDIRRAYVKLARELHPDKSGNEQAVAELQAVGEAWSVLKNKALRDIYDRLGKAGLENGYEDDDLRSSDDDKDSTEGGGENAGPSLESFNAFFARDLQQASAELDHESTIQIAHAVAKGIERAEVSAAARYQRALIIVLQSLDPTLTMSQAEAQAQRAWAEAAS